jgi:MSHA pilin protein MshA
MRRNNGGFTLIELIVVIVILGILAVTAAPKFIDLQSDARLATLNGMKAAINSAVSLTYGKSLVNGKEKEEKVSITINGSPVDVCYGYPCAAATEIQKVLDIGDFNACTAGVAGDWCFEDGAAGDSSIKIFVANGYSESSKCFLKYEQAKKSGTGTDAKIEPPVVKLADDVSC